MITLYVISVFHIYTKWPDVGILCVLYIYPRISPPVREACSLQTRYMSMYSMSHHHTQCHIIIHSVRGAYSMQTRHFCIFIHTYIHICIHTYIHTYIRMLEREREREREKFIDNQIDDWRSVSTTPLQGDTESARARGEREEFYWQPRSDWTRAQGRG